MVIALGGYRPGTDRGNESTREFPKLVRDKGDWNRTAAARRNRIAMQEADALKACKNQPAAKSKL
jgi:hypothetical protein